MAAGSLEWRIVTVVEIRPETPTVKTFRLSVPGWQQHLGGQHYDLRLTAQDGYQAQRSYSIASSPTDTGVVELTIERLQDGEVSSFLHDVVVVGDRIELRGPIGGYFVWDAAEGGPVLLVGGGSGVVPLMAMLRHRAAIGAPVPATLLYSSRSADELIYRSELDGYGTRGVTLVETLTRSQPPGWAGYARRIDRAILSDVVGRSAPGAQVFICGPTSMVEAAAEQLIGLGIAPGRIRTERFGATGR
jgi:ferredoxin-NADP reductase